MDTGHERKAVAAGGHAPIDEPIGEEYVAALAARERAEDDLRASESRYRQALLTTRAALVRSEALYRVAGSLVADETVEALLQRVVDTIAEALGAYRVSLFALDSDRSW